MNNNSSSSNSISPPPAPQYQQHHQDTESQVSPAAVAAISADKHQSGAGMVDSNVRRVEFFENLCKLKKKQREQWLKNCSESNIDTISEACYNILHEVVPLKNNEKLKQKFKQVKHHLKRLSEKKLDHQKKRKILLKEQVGSGIFTLLATAVLPALLSAIIPRK